MAKKASMVTVRDPQASVWQSIVEKVARDKRSHSGGTAAAAAATTPIDRLVEACHASIHERAEAMQGGAPAALHAAAAAGGAAADVSGFSKAKRCSALAAE